MDIHQKLGGQTQNMVYHGDEQPQNKDLSQDPVAEIVVDRIETVGMPGDMEEEEQQQSFAESFSQDEREE